MNLNWDDMRFFLALCRNRTFLAAGSELKVTHSTVARRISALEGFLQTKLFERTEKGCHLTPSAERLLSYAEEMESAVIKFEEAVAGRDSRLTGTIRIGAPDGIGNYYLARIIGLFLKKHPDIDIELIPVPMYFSLLKREIDISITVEKPKIKNVISRKLTTYRLGLFATREYLADRPEIKKETDLSKHRMISYIENMIFDPSLKFMDEFFPRLKPSLKCSTVIAQRIAVLSACGIGIIPYFLLTSKQDLVPVLPEFVIEREYWLTVHPDSKGFARVQAIIDFIVSQVKADVDLFMSLPNT